VDQSRDPDIRRARDEDLPALIDALGQRYYFAERLDRQRAGRGVLLVAWLDGKPVGDVYVWLEPAEEPELRELLPGVPLLNHLEVATDRRNKRIGTALVRAAERLLAGLGHRKVALGVLPNNDKVMRFYTRLGFNPWPHPDVWTTTVTYSRRGEQINTPEICRIFVKDLGR
jgi:GNAT superfamily N-acetyltransferase